MEAHDLLSDDRDFIPEPNAHPNFGDFDWIPESALDKSRRLFSVSKKTKVGQTVHKKLLSAWSKLHEVVGSSGATEIAELQKARKHEKTTVHVC